ncbi:MAG: DsbA family protein [Deltaproteobacteria bacterium]|nr:DsbA family protein [Deltaproteobacteria bacterium]
MTKIVLGLLLGPVLLALLVAQAGFAQPGSIELEALRKDIETLKEGQRNLQKELDSIKSLLSGRQTPTQAVTQEVVLSVDDDPFKGDKNARLALIEFSDYQCPFCARHFRQTLPQIERDYIQTGKVKYVFRDFPIESIHPEAFKAAEAANCSGEQGKYWEMHDRLFANQRALGLKDLPLHAQELGLDLPSFQQCLGSGRQASEIRKDMADGMRAGVRGTPTFFFGYTESNDPKVKALKVLTGAQPYAAFREAIENLLSVQK